MNKLAVTLLFITTTLLNIGCTNNNSVERTNVVSMNKDLIINNEDADKASVDSGDFKKEDASKLIDIPIILSSKYSKETKYLQIKEDASMQKKIEGILNVISKECFNGLPIKATVYGNDRAKIELMELEDKNNRASWKDDYLNEEKKGYTINTIVKNILQEEYKGNWIKTVQLYYEDNLITLD